MIRGSIVAIVSPMYSDGSLDFSSFEKLVKFHCQHETSAIVVGGSTGELATLEEQEYEELVSKSVQFAAGKIPIIAGIGANSTKKAILFSQIAKNAGAIASLSVVPYYNKPTQEGIYRHFSTIADHTDLPQILYNIPGRTVCDMSDETLLRLSKVPNIIGLKDATSDMARAFKLACNVSDDFALYSGDDDTALSFMLLGGDGVISVATNVAPKLMADMCNYALAGEVEKAKAINKRLQALYEVLSLETNPIPIKFLMHAMGLIQDGIRLPLVELSEKYRTVVRAVISGLTN